MDSIAMSIAYQGVALANTTINCLSLEFGDNKLNVTGFYNHPYSAPAVGQQFLSNYLQGTSDAVVLAR